MKLDPALADNPFHLVLSRLTDCLCEELAKAKGPGLCYCGLWAGAGQPPLGAIDCKDGDCGVAWVRLIGAAPSASFPTPDEDATTSCGSPMAFDVEVGVARCAPRPQGRDQWPDPQEMFEANRLYLSDMAAVQRALLCCLPKRQAEAGGREILVSASAWAPLEMAAGKSGGTWTASIGFA